MTSFEELLVSQTTQKAQQNSWMDPSKNWGQNEGLQKAGGQETKEETGNLCLQEGELPKFFLYCLLLRRQASQGQGSLQMMNGNEATIKHKKKTCMIKSKEENHLQ